MATLFLEGFEGYGGSVGAPTNLGTRYTQGGGSTNTTLTAGRVGNLAIRPNNAVGGSYIAPAKSFGNVADWVIGFGFKPGATLIDTRILSLYDAASEQFTLRVTGAGELAVYRGTTLIATSSGAVGIATGAWCFIELKVTLHGSTGSYDVVLNGVSVLSGSGVDTTGTGNNYAQTVRLWGAFTSSTSDAHEFDDLYIADQTSGTGEIDDFVGAHKVMTRFTTAAGDDTDFSPSAGNNYQAVDDNPHDGDTSYVESATTGHRDLYNFSDDTLTGIIAVQVEVVVRETDATPFPIKIVAKSNSTVDDGTGIPVGSTTYVTRDRTFPVDPDSGAAWGNTGLNNAQFGIEVD